MASGRSGGGCAGGRGGGIALNRVRAEAKLTSAALSASLAAQAQEHLTLGEHGMADLYATAALQQGDNPLARGVLAGSRGQPAPTLESSTPVEGGCRDLAIGGEGVLLCAGRDGIHKIDLAAHNRAGTIAWLKAGPATSVAHHSGVVYATTKRDGWTLELQSGTVLSHWDIEERTPFVRANAAAPAHWMVSGKRGSIRLDDRQISLECGSTLVGGDFLGEEALVACLTGRLFLVDAAKGRLLDRIERSGLTYAVASLPDGRILATKDHDVEVFSRSGARLATWTGSDSVIAHLDASPSGRWVSGGTERGHVIVWDGRTGERVASIPAQGSPAATSAWLDDEHLVTGGITGIRVWALPDRFSRRRFAAVPACIAADPWQDRLHACIGDPPTHDVRALNTLARIPPEPHASPVVSIVAGPDAVYRLGPEAIERLRPLDLIPTARAEHGMDSNIELGRLLPDQVVVREIDGSLCRVFGPDLDPRDAAFPCLLDGQGAAIALDRRVLLPSGRPIPDRALDRIERVHTLALSPDARWLALSDVSDQRVARIFDLDGVTGDRALVGHEQRIEAMRFVGDRYLATGSWDGTIRLWALDTWTLTAILPGLGPRIAWIGEADGRLLSVDREGNASWWSLAALTEAPGPDDVLLRTGYVLVGAEPRFVGHDGRARGGGHDPHQRAARP